MPSSQRATRRHTPTDRIDRISAGDQTLEHLIRRMLNVAQQGLPLMLDHTTGQFAFTRRLQADGSLSLQGTSIRYGAIVALGALGLDEPAQRRVLAGRSALDFTGDLIAAIEPHGNLGDIALVTWAAAKANHPLLEHTLSLLDARGAATCDAYTVEAAWVLSALVAGDGKGSARRDIEQARDRLLTCVSTSSDIFPHWTNLSAGPWSRRHVSCFADQVYPIQALARCAAATGHEPSLLAARRCAERICRLQGPAGQWWWHYDCRTGSVIEGYPVYTVHQDSMAPMSLQDLSQAGGGNYDEPIRRGLQWMIHAPEVQRCLIDDENSLIWRKVTRAGPGKLARQIRAGAARVHPRLRLRSLDRLLRPNVIDYEDRPYHLGWILFAWLGGISDNTQVG